MRIYFTSHETQLEGNDAAIFQQKCRAMKLPIQLPVDVTVLKKIQVVDKATGRLIDYGTESDEIISFSKDRFGQIDFLFLYQGVELVFINQFDGALSIKNGLVLIENSTVKRRLLITAADHPKLWIINAP